MQRKPAAADGVCGEPEDGRCIRGLFGVTEGLICRKYRCKGCESVVSFREHGIAEPERVVERDEIFHRCKTHGFSGAVRRVCFGREQAAHLRIGFGNPGEDELLLNGRENTHAGICRGYHGLGKSGNGCDAGRDERNFSCGYVLLHGFCQTVYRQNHPNSCWVVFGFREKLRSICITGGSR